MKLVYPVLCVVISIACFGKDNPQLTNLSVQAPMKYAKDAEIPEKVRAECTALEKQTGQYFVDVFKKKKFATPLAVNEVNEATEGLALKTEIVGITATPGGGWSGGKTMTVKVQLFQDGILIDSAVRSRSSKGGFFGAVKGNCSILERDAETLASDTYVWLVKLTKSNTLPAQLIASPITTPSTTTSAITEVVADATTAADEKTNLPATTTTISKTVLIRTPAVYANKAAIRREILDECGLESALSNYALEVFGQRVATSGELTQASDTQDKDVLEYTILDVGGKAGGNLSGSKSMRIRAQLLRNGEVIDQFEHFRSGGGGGPFGPMNGTCTTLGAVSRSLAVDSLNWYLKRPATPALPKPVATESSEPVADKAATETSDSNP